MSSENNNTANSLSELAEQASALGQKLSEHATEIATTTHSAHGAIDPLIFGITVLVLSCFIGYFVVWSVTPALHSPLMGVTNAISSVIIVGAILAAGPLGFNISKLFGIVAVILASVNIFGGFIVTYRMLSMFKKKRTNKKEK